MNMQRLNDRNRPVAGRLLATGTVLATALAAATYAGALEPMDVSLTSSGVSATASVPGAERLLLRVTGPDGFEAQRRASGQNMVWQLPPGAPDGVYRFDVYAQGIPDAGQSGNNAASGTDVDTRATGRFEVKGGMIVSPEADTQSSLTGVLKEGLAAALEFVVPTASAADLTAESGAPRVNFDDTGTGAGNDWYVTGNGFDGSPDNFYVRHAATGDYVMMLREGAGNYAFEIDSNEDVSLVDEVFIDGSTGRLGISTATPQRELHVVAQGGSLFESAEMRLQGSTGDYSDWQQGLSGLWLVNYDVDADSTSQPVKFTNGTPTNTLVTTVAGNVGIGTNAPERPVHVVRDGSGAEVALLKLDNPTGKARFAISADGQSWTFDNTGSESFTISRTGTGVAELLLDNSGNLTVQGTVNTSSSRELKEGIESIDAAAVLSKIEQLDVAEWSYKTDGDVRHVGPMAEDFHALFAIGNDEKHLAPSDLAGVAVAGVKGLNDKLAAKSEALDAQAQSIEALRAENEELKERLSRLQRSVERLAAAQAEGAVAQASIKME